MLRVSNETLLLLSSYGDKSAKQTLMHTHFKDEFGVFYKHPSFIVFKNDSLMMWVVPRSSI